MLTCTFFYAAYLSKILGKCLVQCYNGFDESQSHDLNNLDVLKYCHQLVKLSDEIIDS